MVWAVSAKFKAHPILAGVQRQASAPDDHVWLSASAGTGKTFVLSARVLRLLLRGAKPDAILCLTFTKAGAAEMAARVHERLAAWVRLDDGLLFAELEALGEDAGPEARKRARQLFATVLEARGGGLRIMTIHAFCQTLLAGFPIEAGLVPGFRPIEGRDEAALQASVLTAMVLAAEREGEVRLLDDLSGLARRLGEDEARSFLRKAASARDALDALPDGPDAIDAFVRRAMDVPAEYTAATLVAACEDGAFDRTDLYAISAILGAWGKTGVKRAEVIAEWLHAKPQERVDGLGHLHLVWAKADGALRSGKGQVPPGSDYADIAARLHDWCGALCAQAARAALAADVASALNAGRRYARAYAEAKRVRGLVDFNDLIRMTGRLLQEPGIGDWIAYKIDQATDHILVDEAQDTNLNQWQIVANLSAEFFAGEGARTGVRRTIFTVGDFKQAIFGFQGTDPIYYAAAAQKFGALAHAAGRGLAALSLDASFRSSQPVLDVVDAVLAEKGADALGLADEPVRHASHGGGFGAVTLLQPVSGDSETEEDGEEGWIADHVRKLATMLAKQVKAWLDAPLWLHGKAQAIAPGDIMILVRKRGDLAALLVARLQEEGVAVAGVDRLRLKAPLVVKDLLAAMRFAVQRDDDLTLASLLVSPLFGWSQDDLFAVAHGRKGHLWDAVPQGPTRAALVDILNLADRVTPFAFLETLLSGPLAGRRKLVARLGEEARDPIEELLSAALQFGRERTPSLQAFLAWFDADESEIVRDAGGAGDTVRVLTVHGAKGLEAPLVILADAAGKPGEAGRSLDWLIEPLDVPVPLFRPRANERALVAALQTAADDAEARERREHWRLLYVAMTRAQERLVVAGSLSARAKGMVPEDSWHASVGAALRALGCQTDDDPDWGARLDYSAQEPQVVREGRLRVASDSAAAATAHPTGGAATPDWLHQSAPPEARPPRPLAPSSLGLDAVSTPPTASAQAAARGQLLHGLFERLPSVAPADRGAAGRRWLNGYDEAESEAMINTVLSVIEDARFADLFAPEALAEAPIAGVANGIVVSGTVDRLVVTDDVVTVIDFKTGRRVPQGPNAIPGHHLRQMAAYAGVLETIFPGRRIEGALLYTAGPVVHRLDATMLAAHKPGLGSDEHILQPMA